MESLNNGTRSARARGASMVEYALLTVAIVVACAAGFRALGHRMAHAAADGTSALGGSAEEVRVAQLPGGPQR
jgi:Flp pilus assembly pilin Flp